MTNELAQVRRQPVARLSCLLAIALSLLSGCDEATNPGGAEAAAGGSSNPAAATADSDTGDHPRDGTGFTKDPCSLLTDAEMSQAQGRQVKALPSSDDKMCEWTPGGETTIDAPYLKYQVSPFDRDVKRDLQRPKPGAGLQRVEIGDGALLNTQRSVIDVVVGQSVFEIGGGVSTPLSNTALVDLARLAQSRVH